MKLMFNSAFHFIVCLKIKETGNIILILAHFVNYKAMHCKKRSVSAALLELTLTLLKCWIRVNTKSDKITLSKVLICINTL